jgi:SAM-dependent methyltransferase
MTDAASHEETHAGAEHFCRLVRSLDEFGPRPKVLVAGCGRGHEALFIRKELDAKLTGVDVGQEWEPVARQNTDIDDFELFAGSVLDLPFADGSFDIVFYHHVIEHVSDPARSLAELARVLRRGGLLYLGTPNRHRAVGYLGSFDAGTLQKLQWNMADYKARLRGRFHNEMGAHAGFSEKELTGLLRAHFTDIRFLTSDYLRFKYGRRLPRPLLQAACSRPLREVAAPSVYAVARHP